MIAGSQRFGMSSFSFKALSGGRVFILMQAVGWTIYGTTTGLGLLLLLNSKAYIPVYGETSFIGALGFAGNAILNFSLDNWRMPSPQTDSTPRQPRKRVGLFFSGILFSLSVLTDGGFIGFLHTPGSIKISAALVVASSVLNHMWAVLRIRANSTLLLAMFGGTAFQVLQAIGWVLICVYIYCAMFLADFIASDAAFGVLSLFGFCGLAGNAVILMSFEYYCHQDKLQLSPDQASSPQNKILSTPAFLLVFSVSWLVQLSSMTSFLTTTATTAPLASQVGLLLAPVFAHLLSGVVLFHRQGYKIFQPFTGGELFVIMQSVG